MTCNGSEIAGGIKFLKGGEDSDRVSFASTRHKKSSINSHFLESNWLQITLQLELFQDVSRLCTPTSS